jgi:hypothetical protein
MQRHDSASRNVSKEYPLPNSLDRSLLRFSRFPFSAYLIQHRVDIFAGRETRGIAVRGELEQWLA